MKKYKFIIFPLVAAVSAVTALTACSGGDVNQGPELTGVNDLTCLTDTTVDLLDGVAALDLEDGDITADLKISVTPEVKVENGYVTFTKAGKYDICYEVYDSQGKYARTTVGATVQDREILRDDVMTNGFSVKASGGAKLVNEGLNGETYSFKATGCEIAEDLRLTRTYALVSGVEYTFKYFFECSGAGRIKIAANGTAFKEQRLNAGDGELEFTYAATDDAAVIELWLGGLGEDLEFSLSGAETSYLQEDGERELAENFDFRDRLENRDNRADAIYTSDDGRSATVEINNPTGTIWEVGMFVRTDVKLEVGNEYTISFDVESRLGNPFQICIQKDQWNEGGMRILESPTGHISETMTATDVFSGYLWLYVRSGENKNVVTVSNLSVKVKASGYKTETYAVNGVYANSGDARCEHGKIIYELDRFDTSDWGRHELCTPSFDFAGATGDYVITFKAKASAPVTFAFAACLSDRWDTFLRQEGRFTTEEKTYSFRCDDKTVDGNYKLLWQFGTAANASFSNVKIEISDIIICYLSDLER